MAKTGLEVAVEFMAYCVENYEKGWDFIVECHTVKELAAEFDKEGITTKAGAIKAYKVIKDIHDDRTAEAAYQREASW